MPGRDAGRVVKGVNFEGLRDAGDPVELATRYNAEGADELSSWTSRQVPAVGRPCSMWWRTADAVFIPDRGGGGGPVDDFDALLRAGADKVGVNTGLLPIPTC